MLAAYFVSYSELTSFWVFNLRHALQSIDINTAKAYIDKLYLSGVVPIVFILLLIAAAYLINRAVSFIASFIPFIFSTSGQLAHHSATLTVWQSFPQIQSLNNLEMKINQVVEKLKLENNSPYLDQLKWQKEDLDKEFSYLSFLYFLVLFMIACYTGTKKYVAPALTDSRLLLALLVSLVAIIAIFFRMAYYFFRTQETKLMIVEHWLQSESDFTAAGYSMSHELYEKIEEGKKIQSKWWSVSIGYRINWLSMYTYYNLKPPFYRLYQTWKYKRLNEQIKRKNKDLVK